MLGKVEVKNIGIIHLVVQVKQISGTFPMVHYKHIFSELNTVATNLSKKGLLLHSGSLRLEEFQGTSLPPLDFSFKFFLWSTLVYGSLCCICSFGHLVVVYVV